MLMNVRVVPHKRGRGKWAVDYRCPVTKKRKYESFASKKAAVARKKKLEGEHASGTYRPLHAMTWPDFVAEYREKVQIAKKLNTRKVEDGAIAMFQKHCSPTSLRAITTKTVDEFRTKRSRDKGRKNKTVSGDTVNKELRALRTILKKAHEWHYLPEVPKFTLKKTSEPEPRAIPIELFTAILDAISVWDATVDRRPAGWRKGCKAEAERKRKVRHKAPPAGWWLPFLSSAYYAGLRWGELLGLKWNDLRFTAAPSVRIWNEKCNRWDYVPLSVTLAERLQTWMATAAKVDDSDLVFPHSCHSRTILAIWKRLQKLAGIEEQFRFHDLRVSFCTNLVATGVEAPQLKQLARHRSIETTMKYYRGRTEEADRRALDRMEAAFSTVENERLAELDSAFPQPTSRPARIRRLPVFPCCWAVFSTSGIVTCPALPSVEVPISDVSELPNGAPRKQVHPCSART